MLNNKGKLCFAESLPKQIAESIPYIHFLHHYIIINTHLSETSETYLHAGYANGKKGRRIKIVKLFTNSFHKIFF